MPPITDIGVTPPGLIVIKQVGLGQETFDVEIEYFNPATLGFETATETNVVRLAVTTGGALLISPNGGGPAHIYSPSGYTHAKVVRRPALHKESN